MYVFATSTCVRTHEGVPVTVRQNDPWYADDPFVKAHPDLFSETPVAVTRFNGNDSVIEAATSRPGEKRSTRRAR